MQVIGFCRFSYPAEGGFQVEHDTTEARAAYLYAPERIDEVERSLLIGVQKCGSIDDDAGRQFRDPPLTVHSGHLDRGVEARRADRELPARLLARHPHQRLAAMGEMEPRHVAKSRHAQAPRLGKARAEVERAAKRQAGEDVAQEVQHAGQFISNISVVQNAGRSSMKPELSGIQATQPMPDFGGVEINNLETPG